MTQFFSLSLSYIPLKSGIYDLIYIKNKINPFLKIKTIYLKIDWKIFIQTSKAYETIYDKKNNCTLLRSRLHMNDV
jgi:hypothetical protein